jgi:tetratricopeptide (TPR) repeat protein
VSADGPGVMERSPGDGTGPADRTEHSEHTGRDDRDERWYLTDERDFLRRSLDDADREHEAGDLSDEDHALLAARDSARLVEVEAALATLGPEPKADEGSAAAASTERRVFPLWRRIGVVAASLLIVTGVAVLVVHSVQGRQPGQFSSGSVTVSQAQQITEQLSQALALNNQGNEEGALQLYDKVLSEDPSNPAALSYAGYVQWNIGSSAHVASLTRIGRAEVQKAVRGEPTYYEAHLFLGLILENEDHNNAAAVTQFNEFLADHPPSTELPQVASLVAGAYQAAGDPVPAALTAGSTAGSGTGSGSGQTPTSSP